MSYDKVQVLTKEEVRTEESKKSEANFIFGLILTALGIIVCGAIVIWYHKLGREAFEHEFGVSAYPMARNILILWGVMIVAVAAKILFLACKP